MITTIILMIIYLAFISLGLPDSILGVTLPSMQQEWGLPLSAGGIISMTVIGSTIVSSFLSGHIIEKTGTGKITFISCSMTALSLLGFSFAPSYIWLLLLAVPLGLGGGSVDSALNNYVALNFKAHHMNWLHSFWGVGATLGPVIMSFALMNESSWRQGYRQISIIQLTLSAILLISLPLWKKIKSTDAVQSNEDLPAETSQISRKNIHKIKGVRFAFLTLILYCAAEAGVGLWGSSFLIQTKNFSMENAALFMALYYGGITLGRFLSGFISFRLSNVQMIRYGIITASAGVLLLLLPEAGLLSGAAFILIGLGLSPVFPSMLHETPVRFGKENSQILIGYQMGFAYMGSALLSPMIGVILEHSTMLLFPVLLVIIMIVMFTASEILTKSTMSKSKYKYA